MSVTVLGVPQLERRLKALDKLAGRELLRNIQVDATRYAKERAPHRSTNLRRSIIPGGLTDSYTIVKAEAAYAAYVEFGTRPHVIKPRNKSVLRFPAKGVQTRLGGGVRRGEIKRLGNGAYTFARIVHHPGTRAQPFLVPAAKQAVEENVGANVIVKTWNEAA